MGFNYNVFLHDMEPIVGGKMIVPSYGLYIKLMEKKFSVRLSRVERGVLVGE